MVSPTDIVSVYYSMSLGFCQRRRGLICFIDLICLTLPGLFGLRFTFLGLPSADFCIALVCLFSNASSLLDGDTRLVFDALRAWRIFVLARVRFIRFALSMSLGVPQVLMSGTIRPFFNPLVQRHFSLRAIPVFAFGSPVRLQIISCSGRNSVARISQ